MKNASRTIPLARLLDMDADIALACGWFAPGDCDEGGEDADVEYLIERSNDAWAWRQEDPMERWMA